MKFFKKISIKIILLLGILLCLFFNPYRQIKVEKIKIKIDQQKYLIARIYTPQISNEQIPNIIVTHGVSNSKEQMNNLSLNIAHGGMRAISFDFGNFGESYRLTTPLTLADLELNTIKDTEIVIDFLRKNLPYFQFDKLGIIGHSMGGATTLQISSKFPDINSSVVMSMGGYANKNAPKNLLFTVGVYEQLNPLSKILNFLDDNLKKECDLVNNLCGNFQEKNARKIFISGTTDHIIAPYDYQFNQEIVTWLQKSFNLPVTNSILKIGLFLWGIVLVFISLIPIHIQQLIKASNHFRRSPYLSKLNILVIVVSIYFVNFTQIINTNLASILIIYLLIVTFISDYILLNIKINITQVYKTLIYLFLILNTVLVSTIVLGLFVLKEYPQYFLQIPNFIIQWWFFIPYNYALNIKVLLFPQYSFNLQPSWLFWLLIALEFIRQGIVLQVFEIVIKRICHGLRQPFSLRIAMSKQELLILMVLLICAIFLVYQRLNDDIISTIFSLGFEVLKLFIIMILLPIILTILIIKNKWLNQNIISITD